jgi:hypothetical protein
MDNDKNPKLNVLPQIVIDFATNALSHPNVNVRQNSRMHLENIKKFCEDVLNNRMEVSEREPQSAEEYFSFGNRHLKRR